MSVWSKLSNKLPEHKCRWWVWLALRHRTSMCTQIVISWFYWLVVLLCFYSLSCISWGCLLSSCLQHDLCFLRIHSKFIESSTSGYHPTITSNWNRDEVGRWLLPNLALFVLSYFIHAALHTQNYCSAAKDVNFHSLNYFFINWERSKKAFFCLNYKWYEKSFEKMQVTLSHIFPHNIFLNTGKTDVEKCSKFSEWKHEKTGLWKNTEQLPWNF